MIDKTKIDLTEHRASLSFVLSDTRIKELGLDIRELRYIIWVYKKDGHSVRKTKSTVSLANGGHDKNSRDALIRKLEKRDLIETREVFEYNKQRGGRNPKEFVLTSKAIELIDSLKM